MSKLLLITGPSGAGKSTVCRELSKTLTGEWAYINQDEVRQYVVSGYASADGELNEWTDAVRRQWNVSIPICADIAKNYIESDIGCVIDFFAYPDELENWLLNFQGIDLDLIILLPVIQALQERNAHRPERSRLSSDKIKENHEIYTNETFNTGTVVDTTDLTVSETVSIVKRLANVS